MNDNAVLWVVAETLTHGLPSPYVRIYLQQVRPDHVPMCSARRRIMMSASSLSRILQCVLPLAQECHGGADLNINAYDQA
jgi:hypothetical protein